MLAEVKTWLGTGRVRALIGLLIATGLASLILQIGFPGDSWSLSAQTALVLIFFGGVVWIVGSRMTPPARRSLIIRVVPALVALGFGMVLPRFFLLFLGAAVGWLIISQIWVQDRSQREYKQAIKAMRKRDYQVAIEIMNTLIHKEPQEPAHYSFRAQLHRLNDDLRRARHDYKKVIDLDSASGVGQNGLAEITLQEGNLEEARRWSEEAYQKAPQDWAALYNLGMIAERQQDDAAAQGYLQRALKQGLPDSRHRLLATVWLIKVCQRLDDQDQAETLIKILKKEKTGLQEWKTILESEEASTVRQLLEADVKLAEKWVNHAGG